MTYLDRLGAELARVGIHGRLRTRILAEAADHLAEGDESRFGDPAELAQRFADELATDRSRRAAFASFAALGLAAAGFAAAWILTVTRPGGSADILSAEWAPLGVLAAVGMIVFPQVSFAAGSLALLRAVRRRSECRLPGAEVGLLLTRTRVALAFGGLTLASVALYAFEFRASLPAGYGTWVPVAAVMLETPLVAAALVAGRAAAVRSSVPGEAGDVFDDLPLPLPRQPWLLCGGTAAVLAVALLAAAPGHEGIRNAVAEVVFLVVGFLALGKRLGLRR